MKVTVLKIYRMMDDENINTDLNAVLPKQKLDKKN
jgi:hypothetical protein